MAGRFDVIIPATSRPVVNTVVRHLMSLHAYVARVVVVDFKQDEPSLDVASIDRFLSSRVPVQRVFVTDQVYFNKSLALNIGFHFTRSERILVCDADVLLHETFFSLALSNATLGHQGRVAFSPCYVQESEGGVQRPAPGIVAFDRACFEQIEGYSSEFTGWGMEDMDFLRRLRASDTAIEKVSSAIHISHPDSDRVRNYDSVSVDTMRKRNRLLYEGRLLSNQMYGTLTSDMQRVSAAGRLCYDKPSY